MLSPRAAHWPEGSVFTVGHSTMPIERFIALLQTYGVKRLVDIRSIPRSRHNPQFDGASLADSLTRGLTNMRTFKRSAACGARHKDSPNAGWRNAGFRGYADYMQTQAFAAGLETLIAHEPPETHRHHVRGSRAVALPPFAGRRRAQCARHPGGRNPIADQLPPA